MTSFHCEVGSVKRVAVIGAGVSGLVAVKSCLEEKLEPVCFERSSFIGGLWSPHKTNYDKEAFAYKPLIFNTSKEMTCFSDFPYPKSYPPYIRPQLQYEYLKSYADHFGLLDYIRLNTTVVSISPTLQPSEAGSGASNQRWRVKVRETLEPKVEVAEEIFDAVMICNGIEAVAEQPEYPGQGEFPGRTMHSCHFRQGLDYERENVLVVGDRSSAGDVAVECSRFAKIVYLSTRAGTIVLPRFVQGGVPLDAYGLTRFGSYMPKVITDSALSQIVSSSYNSKDVGLDPTPELRSPSAYVISDELVQRITYGLIKPKPSMKEFKSNRVVFSDGTEEEVDTVIFATGYSSEFPFIDDSILSDKLEERRLYLHIFATTTDHPTLAAIGITNINSATGPLSEIQARCAVAVFKGRVHLPSKQSMERRIANMRAESIRQSGRLKPQVSYVSAMSELAKLTGCYPDIWRYILRGDFKLASCLLFKPFYPYVTRLEGRHSWPGARQAIIDGMDNMFSATKSPSSRIMTTTTVNWNAVIVLMLIVLVILYKFQVISFN